MALVLSLRQNESFYVGDVRFELSEIEGPSSFWLWKEGDEDELEITDLESVEIAPDVKASSGGYFALGAVRIVLEAPREILILSERNYLRGDPRAAQL